MFDVADGNVNQFEFCCKKIGLNFLQKLELHVLIEFV
jgi:hypothetical protein